MEAIILAGGFGTRLRDVVSNVPKPLAKISGKPFLEYIIEMLIFYKIKKIYLALHYMPSHFDYLPNKYSEQIDIINVVESTPLLSGGAVLNIVKLYNIKKDFILINGDTYNQININSFCMFHKNHSSDITISARLEKKYDRFNTIKINNKTNKIEEFLPKNYYESGYINTGYFIINPKIFNNETRKCFSLENDYISKVKKYNIYAFINQNSFIDIGTPESYKEANIMFKK